MPTLSRVIDAIPPGSRVFLPGATTAPTALLKAWGNDPDRTRHMDIVTSMVPGINDFNPGLLHPSARVSGLFMQPSFCASQRAGQFRHLPLSFGGFVAELPHLPVFDVCVVQVAPPDGDGRCSLGPCVELTLAAAAHSRRIVGIINHALPAFAGAPSLPVSLFSAVDTDDHALATYETGAADAAAILIAKQLAEYIGDGAALQTGIGKVPAALMAELGDRRRLRIHTGMYGEGVRALLEAGALDDAAEHCGMVFSGSTDLYDWAKEHPTLRLAGCEISHDVRRLAAIEGLVAVNSALEVDLFGQGNAEIAAGRMVSGVGGAPDFARAAKLSRGGLSVLALPATARGGTLSRIVSKLDNPHVVSVPRTDIDLVVTEFGAADFRGRSVYERAESLIDIAAPAFRDSLARSWQQIRRNL